MSALPTIASQNPCAASSRTSLSDDRTLVSRINHADTDAGTGCSNSKMMGPIPHWVTNAFRPLALEVS
jgi:hypothetical protein